jgi:hypothetical protein
VLLSQFDGLAMRVNHASSASGNITGFGFRKNQSTGPSFLNGSSVQYNLSTDKIAISMIVNPNTTFLGTNDNVMIAIHFIRRFLATNPGFLAQA